MAGITSPKKISSCFTLFHFSVAYDDSGDLNEAAGRWLSAKNSNSIMRDNR
ncbi:hypothetical protein QFZ48_004187 [Chitinophaga sp. W2I13]